MYSYNNYTKLYDKNYQQSTYTRYNVHIFLKRSSDIQKLNTARGTLLSI